MVSTTLNALEEEEEEEVCKEKLLLEHLEEYVVMKSFEDKGKKLLVTL